MASGFLVFLSAVLNTMYMGCYIPRDVIYFHSWDIAARKHIPENDLIPKDFTLEQLLAIAQA